MRSVRRGSTLLTVLFCLVGLGLLGLCMSSALLSHYTLAVRYRDTAEMDALARAGVAEFIHRCNQRPPGDVTTTPEPVLPSFRGQEVLIEPNQHLPGRVRLLLQGPNDSRDNTLSPLTAQSCFDSGSQQSIPPFSLDLVLKVELAGHSALYEALIQQRWPYAIAAPSPIRILGSATRPLDFPFGNASEIKGSILAMECSAYKLPSEPMENQFMHHSEFDLFKLILAFSPGLSRAGQEASAVQIGGMTDTYMVRSEALDLGGDGGLLPVDNLVSESVETAGAKVTGDIDIYRNLPLNLLGQRVIKPEVQVGPSSIHKGKVRTDMRLGGLDPHTPSTRQKMEHLFDLPDFSHWQDIHGVLRAYQNKNITITSHPGVPNSIYVPSGKARCASFESATGCLTLDDCSLGCEGDLKLGQPGSTVSRVLQGSNATLVVSGQLLVDGGELDAGGKSMVVFADSFLIRAAGRYNGLLVGRSGGAFYGMSTNSNPSPDLVIHGGVLLGANRKSFSVEPVPKDDPSARLLTINGRVVEEDYARSMATFTLISTYIEYDPQYMRGLNQFGGYRLQAMIRRL
ncbi:MAG: hypothetical protein U0931_11595 [Vulcanimicrobiota bacterium]